MWSCCIQYYCFSETNSNTERIRVMTEMTATGHVIEHSGYKFELDSYTINVYSLESTSRVAVIPVLDSNGHRRVHTVPEFEAEVIWWLKDWGVL